MPATVASLTRYPVKSMRGESLSVSRIDERGLAGDRIYALRDRVDGKIATAKNPRKWPTLFAFSASLGDHSDPDAASLRITLPDGKAVTPDQPDVDAVLSKTLGRDVTLLRAGAGTASSGFTSENYWP